MNCLIKTMVKRVKGYLVWVMVFYTVLVTCFLLQSAWNDGNASAGKRHRRGNEKLLNVLFQEERRHLKSFKDVVKTYGGKIRQKLYQDSHEAGAADNTGRVDTPNDYNRKIQSVEKDDVLNNDTAARDISQTHNNEEGAELKKRNAQKIENSNALVNNDASSRKKNNDPGTDNIFIEDVMPNYVQNNVLNITGDTNVLNSLDSKMLQNVDPSSSNNLVKFVDNQNNALKFKKIDKNLNNINSNQAGGKSVKHNKLVFLSNKTKNKLYNKTKTNPKTKNNVQFSAINSGVQHCDKTDAEEPHLCLHERVTYSHIRHINITTNHASFKPLGDLFIYSGFADTRQRPPSLRFMVLAPKGRDNVKNSKYWCGFSFNNPRKSNKNNNMSSNFINKSSATQMTYYAASVGHDKMLQFYIMSCGIPDKHLQDLLKLHTAKIYIIIGTRTSPNLNSIKEIISIDIVNNQGTSPLFTANINNKHNNSTGIDKNSKNTALSNGHLKNQAPSSSNNFNGDLKMQPSVSSGTVKETNISKTSSLLSSSSSLLQPSSSSLSMFKPNSIVSCVSPIFNSVNVLQIVEFIELTLLLGSQHIVLYTLHISSDVTDVLAMYRSKGLVTVLPWAIPVSNSSSTWANGRDIALNDCLYRSMHRYEFVLIHDMDEFFVPRETPDLPSFINFVHIKGGIRAVKATDFVFSSAYFAPPTNEQSKSLTSAPGYTKEVTKLTSLRSVHRTYFNNEHTLRMVRPAGAFRVGAGERKRTTFTISSRFAAVNHYTKCLDNSNNIDNNRNTNACSNTKVDMHIWRIKDRLIRNTKQSIRDVNANRRG